MPDKNISPEKRLLKIIEGRQPAARPTPGQLGKKYLSLGSLRGRFAHLRDRLTKKRAAARPLESADDVRRVNILLQAGIVALGVWLIIGSTLEFRQVRNLAALAMAPLPPSAQAEPVEVASLLEPVQVYLDKAAARDLFNLPETAAEKKTPQFEERKESTRVKEMTAQFKLVGISWSAAPDAIIEDQKAKRTYFVKEGAMIDDIKVQKILRDRVVLKYQSEEVELR